MDPKSLLEDLQGLLSASTAAPATPPQSPPEAVSTAARLSGLLEAKKSAGGILSKHMTGKPPKTAGDTLSGGMKGKAPTPHEAGKAKSGKDLERKIRAKRKSKEGGGHNPFKTKTKLGPGPRKGRNSQTSKWHCKCSNYKCSCVAGKRHKTIKIQRAWKKNYNAEFKAWRKHQRS